MNVVLDTHALVWLLQGNEKLGRRARRHVEDSLRAQQGVISATSFWEIAVLVSKGRLDIGMSIVEFRLAALRFGFHEAPIDGDIAIRSVALADLHGDPADRFIAATAIGLGASLLTADRILLAWKGPLASIDARV